MAAAIIAQTQLIARASEKASSATEWLAELEAHNPIMWHMESPEDTIDFVMETEMPDWMKDVIVEHLEETFYEDYWAEMNETTKADIEQILKEGATEGDSVNEMADRIEEKLEGTPYTEHRATTIARTEVGHCLNGARSAAIDDVITRTGRGTNT